MFYCLWNYFHKILIILSIYKCTCILKMYMYLANDWWWNLLQRPKIYKRFHILRISPLVYIWDWVHVYETRGGVRRSRLNDIFCKKYLRTQFLFELYKIFMIPTSNSFPLKLNDVTLWVYTVPAILMIIRFFI